MADEDPVIFNLEGAVARITLNRPEKRNALNGALITALKRALRTASDDPTVRVIVLTGAGPDFCSGADLQALQKISGATVEENVADAGSLVELFTLIRQVSVPVVASVRGRALAGGCGLATACDLVLASRSARFGYPEVKLGFVPAIVLAIMRRSVSEKRAFDLITRGVEISAEQAQDFGLVNEVFDDGSLDDDVNAYIRPFEKTSRTAVALAKNLLYQIDGLPLPEALQTGADVNVITRLTADCQKGIATFLARAQRNPERG